MTHVMVTEFVQQQTLNDVRQVKFVVPNLARSSLLQVKLSELQAVPFFHFTLNRKYCPPIFEMLRYSNNYTIVEKKENSVLCALQKDFKWLQSIIEGSACEWSGYMNNLAIQENKNENRLTRYMFGPIIDSPPRIQTQY